MLAINNFIDITQDILFILCCRMAFTNNTSSKRKNYSGK